MTRRDEAFARFEGMLTKHGIRSTAVCDTLKMMGQPGGISAEHATLAFQLVEKIIRELGHPEAKRDLLEAMDDLKSAIQSGLPNS